MSSGSRDTPAAPRPWPPTQGSTPAAPRPLSSAPEGAPAVPRSRSSGSRGLSVMPRSWFEPLGSVALPRRPELPDRPQQRRVTEWAAARCDEVAGDVARGGLWRFTEVVADVLFPGLGVAVAAAQRVTKWGPRLVGLNDDRGSHVKIGLVGSENLGLWVLLRTRLGQSDPGPRPDWCTDLPVTPLGTDGVRRDATVLSGIEDVKPADVAPLLLVPPQPGAGTRLLVRASVRHRSGVVAVDAGDGVWQRRLFFTVVHPAAGDSGPHGRYRVVCPVCARRRIAQFRRFDVCSDCGWLDRP